MKYLSVLTLLILVGCLGLTPGDVKIGEQTSNAPTGILPGPGFIDSFKIFSTLDPNIKPNKNDIMNDMALGPDGSLYIAGTTVGDYLELNNKTDTQDIVVMKLSSDGKDIWMKQFGAKTWPDSRGDGHDYPTSIVYTSGFVYVSGLTNGRVNEPNAGSGTFDIFIMKLNADTGAVVWTKQLGATSYPAATATETCNKIVPTSDGGGICLGYTASPIVGALNGYSDAFAFKFDTDGNILWMKNYGPADTIGGALFRTGAIMPGGNLVAVGRVSSSVGMFETPHYQDALIMKINHTNGNVMWGNQLGSDTYPSGNTGTNFSRVVVSAVGDIYALGESFGAFFESGYSDIIAVKYDTAGSPQWEVQLGTVTMANNASSEYITNAVLTPGGQLVIIGSATAEGGYITTDTGSSFVKFIMDPTSGAVVSTDRRIIYRLLGSPMSTGYIGAAINDDGSSIVTGGYYGSPGDIYLYKFQ